MQYHGANALTLMHFTLLSIILMKFKGINDQPFSEILILLSPRECESLKEIYMMYIYLMTEERHINACI